MTAEKGIEGMKTFTELMPLFPNNQIILDTVAKTLDHIEDGKKIMVSVSGGSDSDIVLDLFERIGYEPGQVIYVWFDTGLEYEATKRHLVYLEEKYGIEIQRHKAKVPIPLAVKKYGVPFLSKEVSQKLNRLQRRKFDFKEHGRKPLERLQIKYEKLLDALLWWTGARESSRFTVNKFSGLKEFVIRNPPEFDISDKCCLYAKKSVAHELEKMSGCDLSATGVRRSEGGIRAMACKSCYSPATDSRIAQFRPIFFWSDADKGEYEDFCGVVHSDCYTVYGFKRTGCACCPFGSGFEHELEVIKEYEPKLYKAACNIFGESYEYTRKYRKFKESWKREKRRGGQIDLFDNWEDLI